MSKKVTRREKTRKRRHVERQQRRLEQRRLQREVGEVIQQAVREVLEQALRDEVTALLGRTRSQRRDLDDATIVEACCNRCQTRYRREFCRDGTYKRTVLSLDTDVEVRVPRLSCVCGGVVDFEFVHLEPYNRLWFDLEERGRELAGLCVSLRDSVQVLAWRNAQPISIATLNGRVNQTAKLAEAFHQGQLERVPPVVMLDGVWLKVLLPTDEQYTDKRGRKRRRYKLRPVSAAGSLRSRSSQRRALGARLAARGG